MERIHTTPDQDERKSSIICESLSVKSEKISMPKLAIVRLYTFVPYYGIWQGPTQQTVPHGVMAAVTVGLKRIPLHRAPRTILYTNYSIIVSKTIREPQWLKMATSESTPQLTQLDTTVVLDLHSRLLDRDRSTAPWQRTLCTRRSGSLSTGAREP